MISILISIWSTTENQPNHSAIKKQQGGDWTNSYVQTVSFLLQPNAAPAVGMRCRPDSDIPFQRSWASTLKYKDDLNAYADYEQASTQAETSRALRKWPSFL